MSKRPTSERPSNPTSNVMFFFFPSYLEHARGMEALPKKDGKPGGRFDAACGQTWKHGIRCRLTRTFVGVRSQNEARVRPLGLLAAWLACAVFSEDADEHASAVPFLCFGERAENRNALVAQPNGADRTASARG